MNFMFLAGEAGKAFGVTTIDQLIIDWFNGLFNGNGLGNLILVIVSLLMATLLSGIIGYEREYHGHAAGLRTHILVAVGSALITVISIYGFGDAGIIGSRDPARLIAQVVSGVGFLGAGTIIQTGTDIKGLTTATTLWFVMTIGVAAGSGRFIIAIVATILSIIILISLRKIEHYAAKKMPKILMVVQGDKPVLKEINAIAIKYGLNIKDIQSQIVVFGNEKCLRITMAFNNAKYDTVKEFSNEVENVLNPLEIYVKKYWFETKLRQIWDKIETKLRLGRGETMGQFIYGRNTVRSAIKEGKVLKVYLQNTIKDREIERECSQKGIKIIYKTPKELEQMAQGVHQGVLAEVTNYEFVSLEYLINKSKNAQYPLLVMLDGIKDPHNLGAIMRSCDAFGAQGIIVGKHNQVGLTATVAKVSTGAIDHIRVAQVNNLNQAIKTLKEAGFWVVSSDGSANLDYRQIDYKCPIVLVVGSEGEGISRLVLENSDFITKIPMCGSVNSLNASVAAAIYLAAIHNNRFPL